MYMILFLFNAAEHNTEVTRFIVQRSRNTAINAITYSFRVNEWEGSGDFMYSNALAVLSELHDMRLDRALTRTTASCKYFISLPTRVYKVYPQSARCRKTLVLFQMFISSCKSIRVVFERKQLTLPTRILVISTIGKPSKSRNFKLVVVTLQVKSHNGRKQKQDYINYYTPISY